MKKRLTTLVMLLVAIAAGVKADTYKLWVGETQVTDANKGDILGDGTMKYDPTTNTMTLDGASITSHGNEDYAICNYGEHGGVPGNIDVKKLIIEVKGNSQLSTDDQCLYFRGTDITITGPGELTMKSQYREAICVLIGSLTLAEANIAASGYDSAISGRGSELTIDHSTLKAWPKVTNRKPTIYDFNAVELKACYFSDLEYDNCKWYGRNFYYDDGTCEMYYRGDYDNLETGEALYWDAPYCSWITILPQGPIDVYVGGVQVTVENADDLTKAINDQGYPDFSASGTIRYDMDNHVLTLEDATIDCPLQSRAILSNGACMYLFGSFLMAGGVPGMRIEVYGDCLLQNISGYSAGLAFSSATTIDVHSGAKLTVKAYNYGLLIGDQLDIVEGDISIEGGNNPGRGIDGYTGSTLNLFKKKGTLSVKGAISGITNLNLMNHTQIVSPEGAYYDENGGNIYDSNGYLAHDVVLSNAMTATDINKPSASLAHHPATVYDLQGRLVSSRSEERGAKSENGLLEGGEGNLAPRSSLPIPRINKGIYIINGKKYIYY